MSSARLKTFKPDGTSLFDSALDRVLCFVKNRTHTFTLPSGGSGLREYSLLLADADVVTNCVIYCEFVSTTPPMIYGGVPWTPYLPPLTFIVSSNGSFTAKFYHFALASNIVVNVNFRIFRN